MMNKIEIPLSKSKIALMALGSIAFVAAGFLFIFYLADHQTRFDPLIIKIVGAIAIIFFGATGISSFKKLFDNKSGLIVDENGIIDNSSGVSIGLIEWKDISGIRTKQVMSTKFLLIDTIDPEKYIQKANKFKGRIMRSNLYMYGTPLSIASNALKYNFNDLDKLLHTEFLKYKK
jgi:hypothetical protein